MSDLKVANTGADMPKRILTLDYDDYDFKLASMVQSEHIGAITASYQPIIQGWQQFEPPFEKGIVKQDIQEVIRESAPDTIVIYVNFLGETVNLTSGSANSFIKDIRACAASGAHVILASGLHDSGRKEDTEIRVLREIEGQEQEKGNTVDIFDFREHDYEGLKNFIFNPSPNAAVEQARHSTNKPKGPSQGS